MSGLICILCSSLGCLCTGYGVFFLLPTLYFCCCNTGGGGDLLALDVLVGFTAFAARGFFMFFFGVVWFVVQCPRAAILQDEMRRTGRWIYRCLV